MEELKQSLRENTINFEFHDWRRIVSQQFSNTPLSNPNNKLSEHSIHQSNKCQMYA